MPRPSPSREPPDPCSCLLKSRTAHPALAHPRRSRIIRVGIVGPAPAQVQPDAHPPRYTIRAAQLVPRNALANALAPPSPPQQLLPFGAIQHALEPGSWLVSPRANPAHPYAGYSVDFLEPTYSFDAEMFDILPEPELGACLPRGNSHTREAIAAAALGPAYEQHATTTTASGSSSSSTTPRLRLALEPVSQAVSPSSPSTSRLDPDPTSQSETNPDPMERLELNREALFALFSGRLPRRPWPTAQLVGLDWINSVELPYLRAGRTDPPRYVFRQSASGGAFRGLEEWLTERKGGQRPLARIVEPDFAAAAAARRGGLDDQAYVTGFRLRAKRMSTSPVMGTGQPAGEDQAPASGRSDNPRRRGVGPNGGMAVLWQGRERDPDEDRPPPITTILRAGDGVGNDAPGEFVLRVPGSPPQAPPSTEPLEVLHANNDDDNNNNNHHRPSPELLADEEEVVDSAPPAEGFFPIKPPAEPLSWTTNRDRNRDRDHTAATDEHGHLLAHSLEGYWIGPYSSHGLEILNLTTGLAEFPASATDGSSSDDDDDDDDSSDSEDGRRVTYRRVITATKVTGDPNVPSGQVRAFLTPFLACVCFLSKLTRGEWNCNSVWPARPLGSRSSPQRPCRPISPTWPTDPSLPSKPTSSTSCRLSIHLRRPTRV